MYLRGQKCLLHVRGRPIELVRQLGILVQKRANMHTYVYILLHIYILTLSEVSPASVRAPGRTDP